MALALKNKKYIIMQYFKSPNNKSYIQWNVESGSGFFSVATQNDDLIPSGSTLSDGKFITVSYFSGSLNSGNPVGQQIYQWETNAIKNPNLVEITKEEYDAFVAAACTNVQNNWPTV